MQEPTPERYQPPLTLWSHVWRSAVCLLISSLAWGPIFVGQWREARPLFWIDLAIGVAAYAASFLRRRWPFPVALLLTLTAFVSASAAGPGLLATVSYATRRRLWPLVFLGVIGVVASQVFYVYQPDPSDSSFAINLGFGVVFTVAAMASGAYIGSRRELMWTLRDRAVRAETEQELRVSQARTNERARIAREMHDVLAHRISLLTMHSGALAYRTDLSQEQVRESAELIQQTAHAALTDLRQVLGVLRDDDGNVATRPQPTYADVPALIEESRAAGMHVDYAANLADGLPDAIGRTVYRVIQEGLTNVRKHAPFAHAKVTVETVDDELLTVTIWNASNIGYRGGAPSSGMGLVGLTERVQLAGGRLEQTSDARGFTLRAWLPLTTTPAA